METLKIHSRKTQGKVVLRIQMRLPNRRQIITQQIQSLFQTLRQSITTEVKLHLRKIPFPLNLTNTILNLKLIL
jgi:hypothetical protein